MATHCWAHAEKWKLWPLLEHSSRQRWLLSVNSDLFKIILSVMNIIWPFTPSILSYSHILASLVYIFFRFSGTIYFCWQIVPSGSACVSLCGNARSDANISKTFVFPSIKLVWHSLLLSTDVRLSFVWTLSLPLFVLDWSLWLPLIILPFTSHTTS